MSDKKNILIVDDDEDVAGVIGVILESAGHKTSHEINGVTAYDRVKAERPDVVIADIMMPGMDGFELCKRIRDDDTLEATKVVFVSAKSYEFDRKRAMSLGADGFISKPIDPEQFSEQIDRIVADQVELGFWGVRGTLPVPGERTVRYGGNTSCVTLKFAKGALFIMDAGSGIKRLSDHLMENAGGRLEAKIFISHPHWDHINALPFFVPLYMQGNEVEILGARHGDTTMRELIAAQMEDVYFPIELKDFAAHVYFRDLHEEKFEIDGVHVSTMLLSHPGNCLGYRFDYRGRSVCYITDNELFLENHPAYNAKYLEKLVTFTRDTQILITDCTYTDDEYSSKVGWGHSCVSQVVNYAHKAGVEKLCLFHHDPDQDDDAIDTKLGMAQEILDGLKSDTVVVAPTEGARLSI